MNQLLETEGVTSPSSEPQDPFGGFHLAAILHALETDGFALVRYTRLDPPETVILVRDGDTGFPPELLEHGTAIYTLEEWRAIAAFDPTFEELVRIHGLKRQFRATITTASLGGVRRSPRGARGAEATAGQGGASRGAIEAPRPEWVPPDRVGQGAPVAPQRASW